MTEPDHFQRLGLPRRFALDSEVIEQNYLERTRGLHPDYHGQSSTAEQHASLELTARLNEARSVLRDPFRRADYLLMLQGGPSASEIKEMPPEFLEEMLELRMQIEELRTSDAADRRKQQDMERTLSARREALFAEVATAFELLESRDADGAGLLRSIRRKLNSVKYLQNLLRDLKS